MGTNNYQINMNMNVISQVWNHTNNAELDGAMSEAVLLTPDALMSYCQTRLRGLDDQVHAAFAKQQQANADSSVLTSLATQFQLPSKELDLSKGDPDSDLGNISPKEYVQNAIDALNDAAAKISDPQAKQALIEAAGKLQTKLDGGGKLQASDFKGMTSDVVGKIQQDLNSGAELTMIGLQSLMSQRQQAIQVCTNLVQSLGDQLNKIAENVGH